MLRKLLFPLLLTFLFLGCSQTSTPSSSAKEKLVVGMATNYAPIAFAVDGKPSGVEADFAYLLAKALNRDVQIKILPWAQLKMALETGIIDIAMSGISITKKRSHFALFSEPYMEISQMAVMREGDSAPEIINQGKNSRIGYAFYTTGEAFVKDSFSKASIKGYTTTKQGIAAVMNKEIDYFFHDAPSVWYYTAELSLKGIMGWYVPYTQEHLAWAFNLQNSALRDDVNTILKKWKSDGTTHRIINKWVRVQVVTPNGQKPISFE
ncbi:MAG: transporter substrate-binding domain-containing protein [Campylobacterota bacterium]|nr:transporter substrate-binding domain-containing protein [Campylobacterota bacterium]